MTTYYVIFVVVCDREAIAEFLVKQNVEDTNVKAVHPLLNYVN